MANDLRRGVWEHNQGVVPGFTSRYGVDRPVYHEQTQDVRAALEREKQLNGWRRRRKLELIRSVNPRSEYLSGGWYS